MKTLIIIILFSQLLFANSNNQVNKNNTTILDKSYESIERILMYTHDKMNLTSKYLDEFISRQKDDTIYDKSYLNFEYSILIDENDGINNSTNIDFRLQLPKIQDRLTLVISNDINIDENDDQNYEESKTLKKEPSYKDEDVSFGLLFDFVNNTFNYSFKTGLSFSSFLDDIYPFAKTNISKSIEIDSISYILFKHDLQYSDKNFLENLISSEYIYKISNKYSFYFYNSYNNNTKSHTDNYFHSLRILDQFSSKKYMNYVFSINSNNEESNTQIKTYNTYISYRQYLKKWLYYDIVPSLSFDKEYDFNSNLGLRFNLGILIGK